MAAKPARPWRSSTARAPRRLKKGLGARSAGLRCGQEGHGSQAPYPRRYARLAAERRGPSRQRPGSRWRTRVAAQARRLFPFIERIFADAGYQGPKMAKHRRTDRLLEDRDRQTQRSPPLRRLAQAMDRRADLRLDQPQPPPRARLRTLCPNRRSLRPPRNDPPHAQTPDQAKSLLHESDLLGSALRAGNRRREPTLPPEHSMDTEFEPKPVATTRYEFEPFEKIFLSRREETSRLVNVTSYALRSMKGVARASIVLKHDAECVSNACEKSKLWRCTRLSRDFPLIHNAATVLLWGALEAAFRDFLVRWFTRYPAARQVSRIAKDLRVCRRVREPPR